MKKIAGVTLIEMIIVIVIIGIIAGVLGPVILNATRSANMSSDLNTLSTVGQYTVTKMGIDIRNTATIDTATSSELEITTVGGDTIKYKLGTGSYLTRTDNSVEANQAANASAVTFSYFDEDGAVTSNIPDIKYIRPSFTLTEGGHSETFTTTYFLRNVS